MASVPAVTTAEANSQPRIRLLEETRATRFTEYRETTSKFALVLTAPRPPAKASEPYFQASAHNEHFSVMLQATVPPGPGSTIWLDNVQVTGQVLLNIDLTRIGSAEHMANPQVVYVHCAAVFDWVMHNRSVPNLRFQEFEATAPGKPPKVSESFDGHPTDWHSTKKSITTSLEGSCAIFLCSTALSSGNIQPDELVAKLEITVMSREAIKNHEHVLANVDVPAINSLAIPTTRLPDVCIGLLGDDNLAIFSFADILTNFSPILREKIEKAALGGDRAATLDLAALKANHAVGSGASVAEDEKRVDSPASGETIRLGSQDRDLELENRMVYITITDNINAHLLGAFLYYAYTGIVHFKRIADDDASDQRKDAEDCVKASGLGVNIADSASTVFTAYPVCAFEMYRLAKNYQVGSLLAKARSFIVGQIDSKNVLSHMTSDFVAEYPEIVHDLENFLIDHWDQVSIQPDFTLRAAQAVLQSKVLEDAFKAIHAAVAARITAWKAIELAWQEKKEIELAWNGGKEPVRAWKMRYPRDPSASMEW